MGIATREAYGKALAAVGGKNNKVIVLDADLSKSTKQRFLVRLIRKDFLMSGLLNKI